ncbi:MAG: hypothetical protein VW443_04060 [Pseudomonadales bacterium]|jgi:co-chaperonin GroES (HSP10)
MLKPGSRLKSAVCDAEVMVIKAGANDEVTCGGAVMATDVSEKGAGDEAHMHGCLIGKRYINQEETIELLCVKSGDGSLYCNGEELMTKDTKKLPSSD